MKGLFVDFDGTLSDDKFWRSLPEKQYQAIQKLFFKDNTQMVGDWMRGRYTAEEINQYASETLNIPYQELWDLFVDDCRTIRVSEVVLDTIKALRQKYTVGLVTGNMDSFRRFTIPALSLDDYFDFISSSYDERKHKTDNEGELFVEYAKRLDVDISDCILIDDNDRCCELFSDHGGRAIQVSSPEETLEVLTSLID